MLRITDMTLSCIMAFSPSDTQLKELFALLRELGTEWIEMPAAAYETIRPDSPEKILLRIDTPDEALHYPELSRFVCRIAHGTGKSGIMRELQMNDVKELSRLRQHAPPGNIRIVGLDDILCHDYTAAFRLLADTDSGRVEFCPENGYSCATAAAVEWVTAGGTDLVASFGGLVGKAPLEEVLLSLRIVRRYRPSASYGIFPKIAELVEDITGVRFPDRKAVIGRTIFNVESGIHVDGILKKSQMYEPFLPELVGCRRRFVIGKHSGRKSIAAKLQELGHQDASFDIPRLLSAVREESIGKLSSLTDMEFLDIALRHRLL